MSSSTTPTCLPKIAPGSAPSPRQTRDARSTIARKTVSRRTSSDRRHGRRSTEGSSRRGSLSMSRRPSRHLEGSPRDAHLFHALSLQAGPRTAPPHVRTSGAGFARKRQLLVFDRFLARVALVLGDAATLKGGLSLCRTSWRPTCRRAFQIPPDWPPRKSAGADPAQDVDARPADCRRNARKRHLRDSRGSSSPTGSRASWPSASSRCGRGRRCRSPRATARSDGSTPRTRSRRHTGPARQHRGPRCTLASGRRRGKPMTPSAGITSPSR